MPHVDEGQLHALLDGAFDEREARPLQDHIAACAECATLLEQERAVRAGASAILETARPSKVVTPPFEPLVELARQRGPRRSYVPGPARLAWAATIVLALGVGWFSRDVLQYEARARPESLQTPAADAVSAGDSQPSMPAPPPAPAPEPPSSPGISSAADAREDRGNTAPAAAPAARRERVAQEDRSAADQAGQSQNRLRALERVAAAQRDSTSNAAMALQALQAKTRAARGEGVVGGRSAGKVMAAPPPVAAQQQQTALANVQVQVLQTSGTATLTWESLPRVQAEQRVGRALLLVPDLTLLDVSVAQSGGQVLARTTQRLPGGGTIEMMQTPLPPMPSDSAGGSRGAGRGGRGGVSNEEIVRIAGAQVAQDALGASVLTLRMQNVLITGRAPLPPDSLRALLQRVR